MITVRKATAEDAAAAWDIRKAAILDQCEGHYPPEQLQIWTDGQLTERFTRDVSATFHVAEFNGEVVGTCKLNTETGAVDAIFVDPKVMGQGIGKQMLAFIDTLAAEHGLRELQLDSTLNAAPFYRSCGYHGDEVSQYHSPRGIVMACVPMTKQL